MSVNGITGASDLYSAYSAQPVAPKDKPAEETAQTAKASEPEVGAVYEKSDAVATPGIYAKPDIVAQMKADAERRTAQLQSLVEKLISQQAGKVDQANGSIWDMLRKGQVEVDPETRAQAQADIAEDGYWGVKQTSDRIVEFAQALAGDDPEKLGKMRDAFLKGYEMAEKTWGGKLPEISQQTYDAVLDKFDKLINGDVTDTQA